jgi:hypothetical protein
MQGGALKRKLSAHDSLFLYWEHPEQPFHVAEVMVYEGRFSAADLIRMIEARIHLLQRCRQRVRFTPLGLTHPSWVEDPDFAVRNHVDELELPAPGDDRVLSRVTGELFAELLDCRRPLWKATVLHGHQSGGTVVFLKLHHAMVDGVSSIELVETLHDSAPAAARRRAPQAPSPERSRSLALAPWRLAKAGWTLAQAVPAALLPALATPFNRPISTAREIAWVELPRDEVDSLRKRLGATVNDLVLAQNIVSTNVPGPRTPLFLDGHELLHWYPFAVQWHDLGFVLCTLSYREHLTLGLVADPTVAPDVWEAVDDLRASYEELREAAASPPDGGRGATVAGGLSRGCIGAPATIAEARGHVSVPASGLGPQS